MLLDRPRFGVGCGGPLLFLDAERTLLGVGNGLQITNVRTGALTYIQGGSYGVQTYCASPQGDLIAYASKGLKPSLHVVHTGTLAEVWRVDDVTEVEVTAVAFAADGKRIAAACEEPNPRILVWDLDTAQVLAEASLKRLAAQLQFDPLDGDAIVAVAGGEALLFRLESLASKTELIARQLEVPLGSVTCAAFHPAGIYVGSSAGQVFSFTRGGIAHTDDADSARDDVPLMRTQTQTLDQSLLSGVPPLTHHRGVPVELSLVDDDGAPLPVALITVNAEYVAVSPAASNMIALASHAGPGKAPSLLASFSVSQVTALRSMAFGGRAHRQLAVSSVDGILLTLTQTDAAAPDSFEAELLCDAHSGRVTGLASLAAPDDVASCSLDGSLRVWDVSNMICKDKRTFSAPLTCLEGAAGLGFVAAGNDTGVVRLVSTAAGLPVLFRARLFKQPVKSLALTAPGARQRVLAALSSASTVSLLVVGPDGSAAVAQAFEVGGAVTSMTFARIHGDVADHLLLALASSDLLCFSLPVELPICAAPLPSPPAALLCRRMKVDSPLMTMACRAIAPGGAPDVMCSLFAACADRMVRQYSLPSDPAGWPGARGRAVRSSAKVDGGGSAAGATLRLLSHDGGSLLATADAGGAVCVRSDDLAAKDQAPRRCAHDLFAGGASALTFTADGAALVSGGADGSLIVTGLSGGPMVGAPPAQAPLQPVVDLDAFDDESELVYWQRAKSAAAVGSPSGLAGSQASALAMKLSVLKQKFDGLLARNAAADSLEQLPRKDMVVDEGAIARLKQDGEARVAAIRERQHRQIAAHAVVWQRIRDECVESSTASSAGVTGIRSDVFVRNYAVTQSDAEQRRLAQVQFLRRVEAAECSATGRQSRKAELTVPVDAAGQPTDAPAASEVDPGAGSEASASITQCMYSDYDLRSSWRRRVNCVLLQALSLRVRRDFNASFDRVAKLKAATLDRVAEHNTRLSEIVGDLRHMGCQLKPEDERLLEARVHPEESPENALRVDDSEVAVERYQSEEERARRAAEAAEEARSAAAAARGNCFEKALKQMMNGQLASKGAAHEVWTLEKPAWMLEDAAKWSEEQKRLFQHFTASQKKLDEEREKRRQALEGEAHTIAAALEDAASKMDRELADLAVKRYLSEKQSKELEVKAVLLGASGERLTSLGEAAVQTVLHELASKQESKLRVASLHQELQKKVKSCQQSFDQMISADRQLERALKKEIADAEDYQPTLLAMAKQRASMPQRQAHGSAHPFPPDADKYGGLKFAQRVPPQPRPDGLDDAVWGRFLQWFDAKAAQENMITKLGAELAGMKRWEAFLASQEDELEANTRDLVQRIQDIRSARQTDLTDLLVSFALKNGQLEFQPQGNRYSYAQAGAVLVHKSRVDALNAVICERGDANVRTLNEIKDFKRGMYQLQWDLEKLDMTSADAAAKIRELQLLRVSKELHWLFDEGNRNKPSSLEVQQLETQLAHEKVIHQKTVAERMRFMDSLIKQCHKRRRQNKTLHQQVDALTHLAETQTPMMTHVAPGNPVEARMKSLVTTKRLRDIAKAQQQECAALKLELDRLHIRTFPSFLDVNIPLNPDEMAS